MFCWGNTVNGELGLGGIEENHVLSPEEITNFDSIKNIKSGMSNKIANKIIIYIFVIYFSGLWKESHIGCY